MSASEPPPSTGLIAGKYELLGLIGRGGMGSVWEGRHASLGTSVAIKFIEAEYADSKEARSRFDNEARAAATIQSKHAIQIYDHGVTQDGKPYIVMEMLVGEPLDKRIDRMGRLSLQETARILMQVCRGLQRAHERGIIHRDLKPENIFLVRSPDDDGDKIAKVLDFGIAKIKSPEGMGISSSTKTGAVLGTPFFMSPEQARGLRNVDHRSDVWSLGVIAFKCITGVLPFDGESVGDLLVKICTAPPPIPSQVVPGLPQAFDGWFARALEREPERRFANVAELSDALAYSAGLSVRPRGNSARTPEPNPGYMHTVPADGAVMSRPLSTPGPYEHALQPSHRTPPPATHPSPGYPVAQALPTATSAPFTHSTPAGVPRGGRGFAIAMAFGAILLCGGAYFGASKILGAKSRASGVNGSVSGNAGGGNASVGSGGGSTGVSANAKDAPDGAIATVTTASAAATPAPPPSVPPVAQNRTPKHGPGTGNPKPPPQLPGLGVAKPPVLAPVTPPPTTAPVQPKPPGTVVDPGY